MATKQVKARALGRKPDDYRLLEGQCYRNAYKWAVQHKDEFGDLRVVHGYPVLRDGEYAGRRFGHAWIEVVGDCYDPWFDRVWPAWKYYRMFKIDPSQCRHYTWREAVHMVIQQRVWGPWEPSPEDVVFAPRQGRNRDQHGAAAHALPVGTGTVPTLIQRHT